MNSRPYSGKFTTFFSHSIKFTSLFSHIYDFQETTCAGGTNGSEESR